MASLEKARKILKSLGSDFELNAETPTDDYLVELSELLVKKVEDSLKENKKELFDLYDSSIEKMSNEFLQRAKGKEIVAINMDTGTGQLSVIFGNGEELKTRKTKDEN